jgi:hypothetical protein
VLKTFKLGDRKIVYNNSPKEFTEEQLETLSLGLNFSIAANSFPLANYISATEKLCKKLEEHDIPEDIERATFVRNSMVDALRKHRQMKIHKNLSPKQYKFLIELKKDDTIIVCPADKGRAIVIEDKVVYMNKLYEQIALGDYSIVDQKEDTIINRLQRKISQQLKTMNLENSEKRSIMITAPAMPFMYLLIKVHKKDHPGRPVVNQIDDPTYRLCEILTEILNPLDETGTSYIQDSKHLKQMFKDVNISSSSRLISFDVVALYPSIPIAQTLQIVKNRLLSDPTLQSRTKWSVDQIIALLEISLETYFPFQMEPFSDKMMVHPLGNRFQDLLQVSI